MEVPCVGILCGQASGFEILLDEGRDVEQWLEPRNKLLVFAIDPLSLTLSLSLHCALHHFILHIHTYMLGLFVCLTCA